MKALLVAAWTLILTARVFAAETNAVLYVSPGGSSVAPYDSLATAATNIQTAVDAAAEGDIVQVDAGTYMTGAEIVIDKAITLESIHGAASTVLDGQNEHRVLYLRNGYMTGFTIRNGNYFEPGGGVYCYRAIVENCIITNNYSSNAGGGVKCASSTLRNCLIVRNSAALGGGISYGSGSALENCVIAENSADSVGGGLIADLDGFVRNTIIWNNTAPSDANWHLSGISW
ncbi:hypothetical protein P4C99_04655 [Pontiellaceae bacterium B1224]|nr:hypothetical protein [Pontiellaceae bacterium B1224]